MNAHNQDANRWIAGVAGTHKTLSEAQAIVDAEVTQAQADWDAIPEDDDRKILVIHCIHLDQKI